MLTLLNKNQVDEYLEELVPLVKEKYWQVGPSVLLRDYRFHSAWQYVYGGLTTEFLDYLEGVSIPPLPEECKVTVIYEMTKSWFSMESNKVKRLAKEWFKDDSLMQFQIVNNPTDNPFELRITLIYHAAEKRRHHNDKVMSGYDKMKRTDIKIAKELDKELARNERDGALVRLDTEQLCEFVSGHHLLWTEIANSTESIEEVCERLKSDITRETAKYDVSGLILFIDVDKPFTTMGEVDRLKAMLAGQVGANVEVAVNIRLTNSYIKFITCRAVLVGNPRYIKGEVYEDFGRYEIMLHESNDEKCGHLIVASIADEEFTLSRYDWGKYDHNQNGQTDDHHYFNRDNTRKLYEALHQKDPDALLRSIRKRFASSDPASSDRAFLDFCRRQDIPFDSDYHY